MGATTAGTNGNVVSFDVPSGFAVRFTGMKVTRHRELKPATAGDRNEPPLKRF